MKRLIRNVMVALAFVCLFAVLNPTAIQDSVATLLGRDSLIDRRKFDFAERQWVADARTIMAAIRYIYESSMPRGSFQVEVADIPPLRSQRTTTTNFLGTTPAAPIVTKLQGV